MSGARHQADLLDTDAILSLAQAHFMLPVLQPVSAQVTKIICRQLSTKQESKYKIIIHYIYVCIC